MPSVHLLLIVLGAWLVSSVLIGMVVGRLLRRREEADRPWRASTGSAGNRGPGRTVTVRTPARRRSGLVRSLAWLLAAAVLVIPPGVALSEDALPGDVLYPLKLALEEARLALETDTADRVTLQLELAARRLQELNRVMDGAPAEVTGELTRRLRRFTRAAASELRWVRAEPGDLVARDQVEAALAAHIEALGDLWDERCARDPDGSCAGVRETMAASRELLGDVRAHRERVAVRSRSRRPTDIEVGPTPPPPAAPAKPSDPPAAEENSTPTASPQPASPEPRRPPAGPTEPTGAGRTEPRPSPGTSQPPPAPTGAASPSPAPTPDSTAEPATPTPTPTPTPTRTPTRTPSTTPTPTPTPTPSTTPTPTPTPTPSTTPTPTPTPTPSTTPTPTPTPTPSAEDEPGSTTQTETPTVTESEQTAPATEPEPTVSPELAPES